MTEPATAACNCMGSQQPCHSCSRSLPANENNYAHSLECASTAGDLQAVPRNCQMLQAPHPALSHKSQRHQGATQLSHLFPMLPMSNDNDACPKGHASTTGDTQAVPRTSQALHKLRLPQNLVCHCIHTHVWHEKTTHPFHSLSMSGNNNALRSMQPPLGTLKRSPEHARCRISHTCHSTAFCVLSTQIAEPPAGWEAPLCSCNATPLLLCPRCAIDTHMHIHMVHT